MKIWPSFVQIKEIGMSFNKGYGEIREIGKAALDLSSLEDDRVEWILDTLRKYGAIDMFCEFMRSFDKTSDRATQPGYSQALSDFLNFAKGIK